MFQLHIKERKILRVTVMIQITQKPVSTFTYKKDYNTDNMARLREIRFARFLSKHNLYLAAANHFSHLICNPFPNSKIAQAFSNAQTKQTSFFGLASDVISNQNLQKMKNLQEEVTYKFLKLLKLLSPLMRFPGKIVLQFVLTTSQSLLVDIIH